MRRVSSVSIVAPRFGSLGVRVLDMDQIAKPRGRRRSDRSSLYTSRIIKAGALLPDTKTLLTHWDVSESVLANLERLQRENVFGKASRSRVEDIVAIFRQRYLAEPSVTRALVTLVELRLPASALDRVLYFHAARADSLIHDVVTEWLLPRNDQGLVELDPSDLARVLTGWCSEGKTSAPWSEPTTRRIAQGLLATLRDFGVLQGNVNKRIAPTYLPIAAFCYVIFYLKQHQPSGVKLVEHPDWRLFFLGRESVERSLFEAHQHCLLEYHAAGSVTRLSFPADTLEDYAHVLAGRSHQAP